MKYLVLTFVLLGKSYYMTIWLKMSKETAKIFHKKHSRVTTVQSQCKYGLILICLFLAFSPAQQIFW